MANDLRVEIIGDASSLRRTLLTAAAELSTFAAVAKKHNASVASDTEKAGKRVDRAWRDAESGLIDFKRTSEIVASAVSTERGGPINSLTRGIGNVIKATGTMGDAMQKALTKILPASKVAEQAGGVFDNLGLSMANLVPIVATLFGAFSTLGAGLLILPVVIGGVVAALVALLDTITILSAAVLAFAAPLTVVIGLLGGLAVAFGIVTAASIKNKATQQDVHDNLLKLHVAQQTYNQDVAKYGKNATQTENALIALHKAQDAYEMSQLGVALSTAKLQDKFHTLFQTLAGRFAPTIKTLVNDASQALTYLNKVAQMPIAQAFKSLSTTGISGVTHFIQQVGFMLAKPFRLAIRFGFGVGGNTLSSQVKSLYNELTNFLTGPHGALNPIVKWFHRQDFTETGLRWAHEIISGIVGLFERDKAFHNSVVAVAHDAAKAFGTAFSTVLKFELNELWRWVAQTTAGKLVIGISALILAFGPLYALVSNMVSVFRLLAAVFITDAVEAEAAAAAQAVYAASSEAVAAALAACEAAAVAYTGATEAVVVATENLLAENTILGEELTPVAAALNACAAAAAAATPEVDVLAAAAAAASPEVDVLAAAAAAAVPEIDVLAAAAAAAVPEIDALAAAAAAATENDVGLTAGTIQVEAALTACTAAATEAAVANEALAASIEGATAAQVALGGAAVEATVGLDAAAVSAAGAGVAAEGSAGGVAGLVASLGELAGPIALVGTLTAALVLLEKSQPTPNTRIRVGEAAGQILTGASRPTNTTALKNIRASTEDVITGFDEARAAADRLYNAIHHLSAAKLTLKGDKIQLAFDKNAVSAARDNLNTVLNDPNSKPFEIKGARLQLRQAKFQVQSDQKITLPLDRQAIARDIAWEKTQLNKMVGGFKHAFNQISHNNLGNLPKTLAAFHGHAIKAATGIEAFANRIRKSNPDLAKFKDHEAAMALATDDLTQKIGHVPTTHQVNIYLKHNLDSITRQVQLLGASIDHLQSKSLSVTTTFRTYHINSGPSAPPSEAGGSVRAGAPRMVGERGPELFVPDAHGTILPHAETAKIVRATAEAMSGGLPGAAKDKSARNTYDLAAIRKTMHQMWNFVGGRFFPGYKEPHADFSNRIDTKFFTDAAGEGWNNSKGLRGVLLNPYYVAWLAEKMPLPKKYWKSAADDFHVVLHEWAHAFQNKQTYKKRSLVEGGAEAFSTRILDAVMGSLGMHGSFPKDIAPAYRNFYNTALKQGPEWTLFGQFQHKRYHTHKTLEKYIHGHFHNKHQHDDDGGPPHAPPPPIGLPPIAPLEGGMGPYMHRYGGNAWPGQISLVGEDGPELRREYSPARYTPALDTKRAMGGGEVHNHFHFPNAVIVDAKSIENAAKLVKPSLDRMAGRR